MNILALTRMSVSTAVLILLYLYAVWALSVSAGNGNSFLPVWVESVVYTESVLYVVSVQSPVPVVEKGLSLYSDDSFSVKAC